ncbi:ABC transporter permease [Dawidia soli]|uniref:ABC transporter permease n=1 Tax=Dawidia soli TaxID=2782352 RepID=A0AAP2GI84_9BACT|nr:ABC transporter permease [Dawidia soli]MBT1687996.1 ABC transporter permease [Dawidia soli]
MSILPPRYPLKFLRWFCREDYLDEVEGDLTELFEKQYDQSPTATRWKFAGSVIRYLRPEYIKFFHYRRRSPRSYLSLAMIKNYLTLAFRNLSKRAAFSSINILGLATGVAACLVILHYIDFETSYDQFHSRVGSLYRITRQLHKEGEIMAPNPKTTYGLGPALADELPEVETYIRTHDEAGVVLYDAPAGEARAFHENHMLAVDSTFLRAFTFAVIDGNTATALDAPNNIVITRTIARKYFGNDEALGKTLRLAGGRLKGDYTVTAVLADLPQNSHFDFNILVPMHSMLNSWQYSHDDGWGWNNFQTYLLLRENVAHEAALHKLPDFCHRYLDPKLKEIKGRIEMNLQPVRDIHLTPGLRHDVETVNPQTLYFFGVIGVFILFIAWINYINLSTARALERAREVSIKKTIGALRGELVMQFLVESFVINAMALALAIGLATLLMPALATVVGKALTFKFNDPRTWVTLSIFLTGGTLASGIYPAFVLSSFRITQGLKGTGRTRHFSLRQALVVFQFAASLILMAGTLAVYRQIDFMQSQDKGMQTDQMLIVAGPGTLPWTEAKQRLAIFKDEARKIPGIGAVATSGSVPGQEHNWGASIRQRTATPGDAQLSSIVWIDPDFIPTYNIDIITGKNFDPGVRSSMQSVIINEAALSALGFHTAEEALQQEILLDRDTATVTGVLKNYHWNSLRVAHVPFLFLADTIVPRSISLHLKGGSIQATTEAVGALYKKLMPGDPYEYQFLDDSFNTQYKSDRQFGNIFGVFAGLAVAISCLGLWGLAAYTTSLKLKEIGVRKILGASVNSILYLLCRQFVLLIAVAAVVAIPAAWLGVDRWLQGFAYRIGLPWDLFVVPVLALTGITLVTVSVQVIKGATINPVKVLRSE